MKRVIEVTQVYYPESDGKPMGETDLHRDEIIRHLDLLEYFYRDQKVYVSGDILVYYEQGNPRKFVVPDAFIVKGLKPGPRRVYKIWVEGKVPDLIIETTSRKTRRKDTTEKPELYAQLGVKEYFLFDPEQDYLDPPLQGHRLEGTGYKTIEPLAEGGLLSQELGLRLCAEAGHLQFYRLDNGERLLTSAERAERDSAALRREAEARQREAEARQREAEARRAAEAEIARLRAELERQRNQR